jgi:hypothetical protein
LFETVEQFKYLGKILSNKNSIHEEIKSRLKTGNVCYHSMQNLLSSNWLFKRVKIKICTTIILPVVLYGCESWSPTLREECRLRVFENKVLRRIFGPKRDEEAGEWRRLHKKELYALYSSSNIIRMIKPRRRPLGNPKRGWEDTIKWILEKWDLGMDCIDLAQERDRLWAVVNAAMTLRVS